MDERLLTIIKSMAMGYLAEDDCGYTCLHCDASATSEELRKDVEVAEEIHHKKECPVVLARQMLRDTGTPLNIYKMTGKHNYMTTIRGPQWRNFTAHTLAINEQEAIKNYFWSTTRDLQASFVREFPLD